MDTSILDNIKGWHMGIQSEHFLAACMPATLATSTTEPLAVPKWASSSASNTTCGNKTKASAVAVLKDIDLPVTSTIVADPFSSMWDKFFIQLQRYLFQPDCGKRAQSHSLFATI
jgi:hypothetical protein